MSNVDSIVSGDVLRIAQAVQHTAPRQAQPAQQAEKRELAPVKPPQPAGPGTPSRGSPRGEHLDILV